MEPDLLAELARSGAVRVEHQSDVTVVTDKDLTGWKDVQPSIIREDGEISRDLLFELAGRVRAREASVLKLFWTTMAWGRLSRGRPSVIRSITESPQTEHDLVAAAEASFAGDIAAAYAAMSKRWHYLGPAFFTKFLWVTGDKNSAETRCAILDDRVTVAYFILENELLDNTKVVDYERYCEYLRKKAEQLNESIDTIEATLFQVGSRIGTVASWASTLRAELLQSGGGGGRLIDQLR